MSNGYLDYSLLLAVEIREKHQRDPETGVSAIIPNYPGAEEDTYRPDSDNILNVISSNVETSKFSQAEARHKFKSKCGRYIYHLSIIDYL